MRRLLSGERGRELRGRPLASFPEVRIAPATVQQPLEFWLGGMVESSLKRCGRLADGWLPSLCTPEEALAGKKVIDEAAAGAEQRSARSTSG